MLAIALNLGSSVTGAGATPQMGSDCSRREPGVIATFERRVAEGPGALLAHFELAGCYDAAWRLQDVEQAVLKALAVLDAEIATLPPTVSPAGARPVAGADVPAPKRTSYKIPDYPRDATASGVTGLVVLEIVIGATGIVREARVAKSVPGLDEAAVKSALKWKYEPTLVAGAATEVLGYAPVRFGPTTEPTAADWLEIALFHYRAGGYQRAKAALGIALTSAQEDRSRFGGFVDLYDKSQVEGVTRPTIKKQVNPRYSRRVLSSSNREGKVLVEALVDRLGNVGRVRISGARSHFDPASLEAALEWKFKPAEKSGQPIPCQVLLEMEFRTH